jgi:formiminoglutamate deiminase
MNYHFEKLLTEDGVINNVRICTDVSGRITAIQSGKTPENGDEIISGFTLPGFQNAHSHAFQYAMAGLAEIHAPENRSDSFWSWRNSMYDLALSISPEDLESIATMLYAEMLSVGYTHVAEFHYVHHNKDGKPFDSLSEMGSRLVSAAKKTGINLTLIPIFYQKGGFNLPALEKQRRFISSDTEAYLKLLSSSADACKFYEGANCAIGIHSMRGVDPQEIIRVSEFTSSDLPFHIHIAEQKKEVEDSISALGRRPVEWFSEHIELNSRFHLVHATHLTVEETKTIAVSRANVVLCPSTEANLGDGLFPLLQFQQFGGQWSIGTDSHIGLDPLEELRLLDYGQRLISHNRLTFASKTGDSGHFAIDQALLSGRKAMNNFSTNYFEIGQLLNTVTYNLNSPLLKSSGDSKLASTLVYAASSKLANCTISRGKIVSRNGEHLSQNAFIQDFLSTLKHLKTRI